LANDFQLARSNGQPAAVVRFAFQLLEKTIKTTTKPNTRWSEPMKNDDLRF
jgi:hypothetical protein